MLWAVQNTRLLKRAGAILLLLSLFFPMHSCTPIPNKLTPPQAVKTQYVYAWTFKEAKDPSGYLVLFAFIWPAIAVGLERVQVRRRQWRIAVSVLEAALSIATAWILYAGILVWWPLLHPEAGLYIATSGFALYLTVRCLETVQRFGKG